MATPVGDSIALTGNSLIDGLVQGSSWTFGGGAHVLTYSLHSETTSTWNSDWQLMISKTFDAWENVANIRFDFNGPPSSAHPEQSTSDLAITFWGKSTDIYAQAMFPDADFADEVLADAGLDRTDYARPEGDIDIFEGDTVFSYLEEGGFAFATLLHEIGHAIGLKHPHDDGANIPGRPLLPDPYDDGRWTVMSYDDPYAGNKSYYDAGQQITPMPLDILAIQHIYGANLTYQTGNNVYTLEDDWKVRTIWDAGGTDEISAANLKFGVTISLDEGSFIEHGKKEATGYDIPSITALAFFVEVSGIVINAIENATGSNYNDFLFGNFADNLLRGGKGNDSLDGVAGEDAIEGGDGNDTLVGGPDNDTLTGGAGNDTYIIVDLNDTIVELSGGGSDLVKSSVTYTLGNFLENLELTGVGNINGTGNAADNNIKGNSGNNILDGLAGKDTMAGGAGNDQYYVDTAGELLTEGLNAGTDKVFSSVNWTLGDNFENLELTGVGNVNGTGNALVNIITGNDGDNVLDGKAGADNLTGGDGDDTYVLDNAGDSITEASGEGADTIVLNYIPGGTYTIAADLENLIIGGTAAINVTGNAEDNAIIGNTGANILTGLDGNDTLDGGKGADTLIGGDDDDSYIVDNTGDVITELPSEGEDDVSASATYTLAANIENLTLTGTAAINGTGNGEDNEIAGNDGNNLLSGLAGDDSMDGGEGNDTLLGGADDDDLVGDIGNDSLDGGTGADTMTGGLGNDIYVVDDAGDDVVEDPGEGTDLVKSSIDYTLGDDVENLELIIGAGNIDGTGNALANNIKGNDGENVLEGDDGADTVAGGLGDDTYIVNLIANGAVTAVKLEDTVTEASNAGTDTIVLEGETNTLVTATTIVLGANIEHIDASATDSTKLNITGNSLNNSITGNDEDNKLDGGTGADTLIGGLGDDTYVLDDAGDSITEATGEGTDTVLLNFVPIANTYTLAADLEHLVVGGTAAINVTGNTEDNALTGNKAANDLRGLDGNDTLNGGAGIDTLIGGDDDDTYVVDNINDVVAEAANEGDDEVQASVSYTLGTNIENLTLTGTAHLSGTGNGDDNVITGNDGNNTLSGMAGDDDISGGKGNDSLLGGADDDTLSGDAGNDSLDGGTGEDDMSGGAGDDIYVVDDVGDDVTENASEGTDTVQSSITYTLDPNVEKLLLTGGGNIDGTGNALANTLTGNTGDNVLEGDANVDTLIGGLGDDTYIVNLIASGSGSAQKVKLEDVITEANNAGTDTLILEGETNTLTTATTLTLGATLENLDASDTDSTKLNITGNALNNIITGNDEDNILDGGKGADNLIGGDGDDTYVLDSAGDSITEVSGEGTDTIKLNYVPVGTYTIAADLENLIIGGTAAINVTGNTEDNAITGNTGANTLTGLDGEDTLDGGKGADTLIGGDDDDTYIVDHVGDVVTEANGTTEGFDTVISSVTYTLAADLEHLTLSGTGNINGTGNAFHNEIFGNDANNILSGAAGQDTIDGKKGNDTLDGGNDADILLGGDGNDSLIGGAAVDGLSGNAGNDTLDGGTGADAMDGGTGNDTYVVDDAGDIVFENVSEGTDLVRTSVDYTMDANVENLELIIGTGNIDGTGNALANNIKGNDGDNVLEGGGDADILAGGLGNDSYIVNLIANGAVTAVKLQDTVTEGASAGTDTLVLEGETLGLVTATTLTLGANIENIDASATDSTKLNITGNSLNNIITGNDEGNKLDGGSGSDLLDGGDGNDTLIGGSGNDLLVGGNGSDHFVFALALNATTNADDIDDFTVGDDFIELDNDIFTKLGAAGGLNVNFLHTGAAAADADDYLIYDSATGNLYYDSDGNGAKLQVLFATLDTGLSLANTDFNVLS